jgi:uncharacterized membrane protein
VGRGSSRDHSARCRDHKRRGHEQDAAGKAAGRILDAADHHRNQRAADAAEKITDFQVFMADYQPASLPAD